MGEAPSGSRRDALEYMLGGLIRHGTPASPIEGSELFLPASHVIVLRPPPYDWATDPDLA